MCEGNLLNYRWQLKDRIRIFLYTGVMKKEKMVSTFPPANAR